MNELKTLQAHRKQILVLMYNRNVTNSLKDSHPIFITLRSSSSTNQPQKKFPFPICP